MAKLIFQDIKFHEDNNGVKCIFLKNFFFHISKDELNRLGRWKVTDNVLEIEGKENIARRNFNHLLEIKLQELKSFQGKPTTFIHKGFLPLIGSLYFGIVDRNTNVIEIRPVTGCNLNCIFCSVDMSKRLREFVVQKDYLVEEFEKLAELKLKTVNEIEAHINAQGEPLLYDPLSELIKDISKIKGVKTISIDTNGTLLTKEKVDEFVKAGLTRFNVSLNAFSKETANKISSTNYPLEHVLEMCRYIAKKCDILIASVWLHGINDKDIEEIVKFSLELKEIRNKRKPVQSTPFIGIQNFLEYQFGKRPIKQQTWENFYSFLKKLEEKYNTKLILKKEDFTIKEANVLKKPFKKSQRVEAEIVCEGRFENEKLAKAQERTITIPKCSKSGKVRVKITRDKYNVFYGSM